MVTTTLGRASCYDPEPSPQFSVIFRHLFCALGHSFPHSVPHAPLGPSPNHLTSHLIDHMTNPQSTITCHHSAVRSIMTCPHLTLSGLPAHDAPLRSCQLMMELYLEPPCHDFTLVIFPYFSVTSVTRYFSFVYKRPYFQQLGPKPNLVFNPRLGASTQDSQSLLPDQLSRFKALKLSLSSLLSTSGVTLIIGDFALILRSQPVPRYSRDPFASGGDPTEQTQSSPNQPTHVASLRPLDLNNQTLCRHR